MKKLFALVMIALMLSACTITTPAPFVPPTEKPPSTEPTPSSSEPTAYPGPVEENPYPYPLPPTTSPGLPPNPGSPYDPQPGDATLKRDQVFLDLASSKLVITASNPVDVKVQLVGNLPDPCHMLRAVVKSSSSASTIEVEVYSVVDPTTACMTVLKPFTATIPVGTFSEGQYTVTVNGEKLGIFNGSYQPQPGDDKLTRGEVFLDMSLTTVVVTGTQTKEASVLLNGNLPDPCHQLRIVGTPVSSDNKLSLEVYSLADTHTACITVLQPFEVIFPLGSFTGGHYSVYVNGTLVGEFDG